MCLLLLSVNVVYFVLVLQLVLCCETSTSINEDLFINIIIIIKVVVVVVVVVGRDSSVGIATRFGLGGPGIESQWGDIFRNHPNRPPVPTQPPIQWLGVKRLGGGVDHAPYLTPRLKKE